MQKLGMCLFFDRLQDQQARLGILAQEQKIWLKNMTDAISDQAGYSATLQECGGDEKLNIQFTPSLILTHLFVSRFEFSQTSFATRSRSRSAQYCASNEISKSKPACAHVKLPWSNDCISKTQWQAKLWYIIVDMHTHFSKRGRRPQHTIHPRRWLGDCSGCLFSFLFFFEGRGLFQAFFLLTASASSARELKRTTRGKVSRAKIIR